MDLVAIIGIIIILLIIFIEPVGPRLKYLIIILICILLQISWIPLIHNKYKIKENIIYTDYYDDIQYSEIVKVIKIRKYKSGFLLSDRYSTKIEILDNKLKE
jgi:cell division protein FtsW (lipid II flippase)